jgi:hypothetical protein
MKMRRLLEEINKRKHEFADHPFFAFLRDTKFTPTERLTFAPAGAPFIMAFADLNKHVLHTDVPRNKVDEMLNVHAAEDETHFQMYLRDLGTLGFDQPLRFSDTLEFLWSTERVALRMTCYRLVGLLSGCSDPLRMAIVETIEAFGAVAFRSFTQLAEEYHKSGGEVLEYFGQKHEDLESGHAMGTHDIEERLFAIKLSDDDYAQGMEFVASVYAMFAAMMTELRDYSVKQLQH